MAIWVPESGAVAILQYGMDAILGLPLGCLLFDNNPTLSENVTLGDLNQASFDGYALFDMTAGGGWNYADLGGGIAQAKYTGICTFTAGGAISPVTIYGYYLLFGGGGTLLLAEDFPVPITLNTPGQQILVAPRITCQTTQTV